MTPHEQIRIVAASMSPWVAALHDAVTDAVGDTNHAIVLVVACANEAQFSTNRDHATVVRLMRELGPMFAQQPGEAPLPAGDPIPAELLGNSLVFEHLVDTFERAVRQGVTGVEFKAARDSVIEQYRDVIRRQGIA